MNPLATLQDMALFVEVARTLSFSRASGHLGMPPATLSRRIATMERRLGVRLFDRSTRRVALTATGQRYYERCAAVVDEARLAHEALRETGELASGRIRVSMPVDLGLHWIGPLLPEFSRLYPGIALELDLSPRKIDLIEDQTDVAIRLGAIKGDRLVVRRLGETSQGVFAAPAYLERHGRPLIPEDLAMHECLYVPTGAQPVRWRLGRGSETVEVEVRGRYCLNNVGLMRLLAESGLGVAVLPLRLCDESVAAGRLQPLLEDCTMPAHAIHAVMSSHLQPAAVRAFVAFLAERL
jgi:DNA-binding transcriptional LysR family regulator